MHDEFEILRGQIPLLPSLIMAEAWHECVEEEEEEEEEEAGACDEELLDEALADVHDGAARTAAP